MVSNLQRQGGRKTGCSAKGTELILNTRATEEVAEVDRVHKEWDTGDVSGVDGRGGEVSSELRRDDGDTLRDKFRLGVIGEDGSEVVHGISIQRVEVRAGSSQAMVVQELKVNGRNGTEVALEEVGTEGHGGRWTGRKKGKKTGQQRKVETKFYEPVAG